MYRRGCLDVPVHVSAKVDYAVRALLELATVARTDDKALVKGETIAAAQDIPMKFLEAILRDLRNDGIIASKRGVDGGYRLDRPADRITVADVVRSLEGPLAAVRGERPEDVEGALIEARKLKDRTVFIDFQTDPTENVFPMVQAGKGITEMLLGSEDL